LVFEEIGETAFRFAFVYSVVVTVLVMGLVSGGFPVDAFSGTPLFLPSTKLYSYTRQIVETLPTEATATDLMLAIATIFVTGFLQFMFTLLAGVIALVHTIAGLIPPQLGFLILPLYFVGSLVQLMVWYYITIRVLSTVRAWLPV